MVASTASTVLVVAMFLLADVIPALAGDCDGNLRQYTFRLHAQDNCIGIKGTEVEGAQVVTVDCSTAPGWDFTKDQFQLKRTGLCMAVGARSGVITPTLDRSAFTRAVLKRCDSSDLGQHFEFKGGLIRWRPQVTNDQCMETDSCRTDTGAQLQLWENCDSTSECHVIAAVACTPPTYEAYKPDTSRCSDHAQCKSDGRRYCCGNPACTLTRQCADSGSGLHHCVEYSGCSFTPSKRAWCYTTEGNCVGNDSVFANENIPGVQESGVSYCISESLVGSSVVVGDFNHTFSIDSVDEANTQATKCECKESWTWKGAEYSGCQSTPDFPDLLFCFTTADTDTDCAGTESLADDARGDGHWTYLYAHHIDPNAVAGDARYAEVADGSDDGAEEAPYEEPIQGQAAVYDDGGALGAERRCIQITSSGRCTKLAAAGLERCSMHVCCKTGCTNAKSRKAKFCKTHTAPNANAKANARQPSKYLGFGAAGGGDEEDVSSNV
eukprot:gene6182-11593_t